MTNALVVSYQSCPDQCSGITFRYHSTQYEKWYCQLGQLLRTQHSSICRVIHDESWRMQERLKARLRLFALCHTLMSKVEISISEVLDVYLCESCHGQHQQFVLPGMQED